MKFKPVYSTLLFGAVMAANTFYVSVAGAEEPANPTAQPKTSEGVLADIQALKGKFSVEKKELEADLAKLNKELGQRQSVKNPDSTFQLGTVQLEDNIKEKNNRLAQVNASIAALEEGVSGLAICQKETPTTLKKAQQWQEKIRKRIAELGGAELVAQIDSVKSDVNAIVGLENTRETEVRNILQEIDGILSSKMISSVSTELARQLESFKMISLSSKKDPKQVELLMLSIYSNPSLLTDANTLARNSGRSVDNLLGGTLSAGLDKLVVKENVIPRTNPVSIGETVAFGVHPTIAPAMFGPFADIYGVKESIRGINLGDRDGSYVRDVVAMQLRTSARAQAKAMEKNPAKREALEEKLLSDYQKVFDEKVADLTKAAERLREARARSKDWEELQAKQVKDARKVLHDMQAKADEIRSLEKFLAQIQSESNICKGAETGARAVLADLNEQKLSSEESAAAISRTLGSSVRANEEINRVGKQLSTRHGIQYEEPKPEAKKE